MVWATGGSIIRRTSVEDSTPLRIPGLAQPVTIRTDCWGVPHIEASSADDAFLAQGWVAARDHIGRAHDRTPVTNRHIS
ncbi:penicillin acylase family protein [Streptomyces sp. NPDC020125]|uniref:penicillin acylase family protein n=1 Tax=Streptomyces sp. NPDC020125 TaxID=3154593 RepID=UPI0033DA2506